MNTKRLAVIKGFTVLALFSMVSIAGAGTALNANQAFSALFSGNNPFIQGNFSYLSKMSQPAIRTGLAAGQSPYAIVLGCSDSRVPPEIVFAKGLGEVFPIRVAGNIIAEHEIGSIEYAVEHLCAPLIVVMGHDKCGAVTAAVNHVLANVAASKAPNTPAAVPYHVSSDVPPPVPTYDPLAPYINSLVNTLIPPVVTAYNANPGASTADLIKAAIIENVKYTSADLLAKSTIVREAVEIEMPPACLTTALPVPGKLPPGTKARIVGAKYNLDVDPLNPSYNGKVVVVPLVP